MRTYLTILLLLLVCPLWAQLSVGSQGMTILSGITLTVDGLSLTPSANLSLTNNLIQKSNTPIAGSPQSSISRVYNFSATIPFSGTAGIHYLISELNGNTESELQIAYQLAPNVGYTTTSNSTDDATNHYVFTSFPSQNLTGLTATSRNSALPVTLINFLARNDDGNARLNWTTSWEHNAERFAIEYSPDVELWQPVGSVQAQGESRATSAYEFIHRDVVEGANYYRLKIIDKDASYAYSPIRSVVIESLDKLVVYPNPAQDKLQLKGGSAKKPFQRVGIYDLLGKLLQELSDLPAQGVDISGLPAGNYLLQVQRQGASPFTQVFVKE